MSWKVENMPDLKGKRVIVTGANSGLGYHTTSNLASHDADVIMACRSLKKAQDAAVKIRSRVPRARLYPMYLDLADLDSVRTFTVKIREKYPRIDLLINNAGVMAIPERRTKQGFEMQFGTNHLGHFALTAQLFDLLANNEGSRIVTLSSIVHKRGEINFDDLNWETGYSKWKAYGQSKLANLLFMRELDRRIREHGLPVLSVASHPGYAATNLQLAGPRMQGSGLNTFLNKITNKLFAQSAEMGALPTLYAATAPGVESGKYYGPDKMGGMRGYPHEEKIDEKKVDMETAHKLWEVSEKLTSVQFEVGRETVNEEERG